MNIAPSSLKRFWPLSFTKTLILLYVSAFFFLYFVQTYAAWDYTVDDAFITLRYARHLIADQGLVWNISGPRIEGYSNFIYVLFGALSLSLHLPPILILKSISAFSVLLSVTALYKLSHLWLPKRYCLLSGLLLLMHPGQIIWGVSGLETAFFQSLILFGTYCLLRAIPPNAVPPNQKDLRCVSYSGLLLALASLTRPEGPMLFVCFFVLLCFNEKSLKSKRILYFVLSFTLSYAPYFVWRLIYFGRLFPNTVYCKAIGAPSGGWELDLSYILMVWPLFIFIIPYLKHTKDKRHAFLLLPSLCYLIALYNADWIVGFLDRHFLTALALLMPLFIGGIHYLFGLKRFGFKRNTHTLIVILFSLISGYVFLSNHHTPRYFFYLSKSAKEGNRLRHDVGDWLNTHLKKSETVSLGDCGLIPYLYEGTVIDSYCLNNLAFTKSPIEYSYPRFAEWLVNTKKPDYIILLSLMTLKKAYYPPSDLILLGKMDFYLNYQKVKRFAISNERGGYQYIIYKRKSEPKRLTATN